MTFSVGISDLFTAVFEALVGIGCLFGIDFQAVVEADHNVTICGLKWMKNNHLGKSFTLSELNNTYFVKVQQRHPVPLVFHATSDEIRNLHGVLRDHQTDTLEF